MTGIDVLSPAEAAALVSAQEEATARVAYLKSPEREAEISAQTDLGQKKGAD